MTPARKTWRMTEIESVIDFDICFMMRRFTDSLIHTSCFIVSEEQFIQHIFLLFSNMAIA